MKLKIFAPLLIVGIIALVVLSQKKTEPFAAAKDFPRDALVYAQIADLPAFIKLWNDSKLKEKYLQSSNFEDFEQHHLALKLVSRWEEFNTSVGFPVDLETVSGLAETKAAVALYDIGKLEFVFIAPMSNEVFNATKFVQNQTNFEEQTLEDGTIFYSCNIDADRGRQKQQLLFANVQGRFILATSQKLLLRTLENINGKSKKDRLTDEPLFSNLSEKITPNLMTVWVNQTALNNDYYFKHYWLMGDLKELKNIRAGIFDFAVGEKELVEKREFLLSESKNNPKVSAEKAGQMLSVLPENIPFYRLRFAGAGNIADSISGTLFDRQVQVSTKPENRSHYYDDYNYDDGDWHDYSSLGGKYDKIIDETEDEKTVDLNTDNDFNEKLEQALQSVAPDTILTAARPQILPAPLFAEFNRVTVLKLGVPQNLNSANLENLLAEEMKIRLMISAPNIGLNWETKSENEQTWRELDPPSLGWGIAYTVRGNELIFSNNSAFLQEFLSIQNKETKPAAEFNDLTVIRLNQRCEAFDNVMTMLAKDSGKAASEDFFAGNIGSLLDTVSDVSRIEIKRNYSENYLHEEVSFVLSDSEENK